MKSDLVYMDSIQNSKKGTLRGLVIFPIFILLTLGWFFLMENVYKKHIDEVSNFRIGLALVLCSILIVSAIGVHDPDTIQEAIVYSALVGFVIYGVANLSLLAACDKWNYTIMIIDTVWGVLSTTLLGFILFYVVKNWPNVFAYDK